MSDLPDLPEVPDLTRSAFGPAADRQPAADLRQQIAEFTTAMAAAEFRALTYGIPG